MRLPLFLLLLLSASGLSADPKSHYMIHCMGCHLLNGEGVPPEVPAFNDDLAYLAGFDSGRRYLVQVPGASQSLIDDAALAELINWMLESYAPAHKVASYTESEVEKYRAEILADPKAERTRLFAASQ